MDIKEVISNSSNYISLLKYCIGPLSGAFAGSYITYKLAIRREEKKAEKEKIQAGQVALFTLIRQLNVIAGIKKQIFDKVKNDRVRHYIILSTIDNDYVDFKLDVTSMSYLLVTEFRNTLGEMLVIEDLFHTTINAIKTRAKIHIEFQEALEKWGVSAITGLTDLNMKKIVGDRLCISLEKITNEVYELLDDCFRKLKIIIPKLADELERLFPKNKFIRFELQYTDPNLSPDHP